VHSYRDYLIVLAVAAGGTFLLTFPVRMLAVRVGAIVHPDERRSHLRPTPTLGGSAMFLAFLAAMATASRLGGFESVFHQNSEPLGVVIGAAAIYIVGLVDDVRDMSAPAKVAGQVLAAMCLYFLGATLYSFKLPFVAGLILLTPSILPLVTALWVIGMANAVNLIDGLDGLAAGIVAIGSAALAIYALRLESLGYLPTADLGPLVAVIACGVCLGFLPHNFHPARIFMGDAGAMFLGLLMAAATMLVGGRMSDTSGASFFFFGPMLIPLLILSVPIIDTAFAIVRRAVRRQNVTAPDRGHLHHQLIRLGHGERRAVVVLWAWTALTSALFLYPSFYPRVVIGRPAVAFGCAVLAVLLFTVFRPEWARRGAHVRLANGHGNGHGSANGNRGNGSRGGTAVTTGSAGAAGLGEAAAGAAAAEVLAAGAGIGGSEGEGERESAQVGSRFARKNGEMRG
jgi:UDP-GlcNAc:undecaprenyl-phosphate/decaprenyl-phosphate GlcNAc-1-phosphate transferase